MPTKILSAKNSSTAMVLLLGAMSIVVSTERGFAAPIAIADVKHDGTVDFEREILPIFRRNCLACHSATEAESDLVLENPQAIIKGGGEGPSVVPGNSAASLLLKLSAHQQEPVMPPADNDVKARPLSSDELGLIKLWIDQGAKGDVMSASQGPIAWQTLPAGINPIYAVTVTRDGQYAAAARANQVAIYHVPGRRELSRLTDPQLLERGIYTQPGVADLDLVQSLTFSPDGRRLASGGFRSVKIWLKPAAKKKFDLAGIEGNARSMILSTDRTKVIVGEESGKIRIFDLNNGQLIRTLEGHTSAVQALAMTSDQSKLVSGAADKKLHVWNLADGTLIAAIETPSPLLSLAVVLEDKTIATGSDDNVLRLWDLPTAPLAGDPPKPTKEIPGHNGAITSMFVVSKNQVLTGCRDGNARVVNVEGGNITQNLSHGGPVEAVAMRPDGKRIVSVGANNIGKLWNAENNQMIAEFRGDIRTSIRVSEDTRGFALANRMVEHAKKDVEEAEKRKTAEEENDKKSKEALTAADGEFKKKEEALKQPTTDKELADKTLAEATAAKTKADEQKVVATDAQKVAADALTAAKQDQDAKNKLATDAANALKAATDKLSAAKDALGKDPENQGLKDAVTAAETELKAADDANKVAVDAKAVADKLVTDSDAAKKTADEAKQAADKAAADAQNAFNQADQKLKQVMPVYQKAFDEKVAAERTLEAAKRSVERAAESVKKAIDSIPPLQLLVAENEVAANKALQLLEASKKQNTEAEKPIRSVAFSADGHWFATGGDDNFVHLWDGETAGAGEVYEGHTSPLIGTGFDASGSLVSVSKLAPAMVTELPTEWKLERMIGSPDSPDKLVDRVIAVAFSPDGKLIATGGGEPSRSGELKVWNAETGDLVLTVKDAHSDTIYSLEFSPDGKQLASCGADRFVKVFDVADGKFVRSFEGHTHHVLGVTWRSDGRMLVSSGADNVVKVWDTRTGDQVRTIQGFNKEVTSVHFAGEGDGVLVSSGDQRVRLTNAASGGNIRDFAGATDYIYSAAQSADGKVILAGGADSVLRIWNDQGAPLATFAPELPPAAATEVKAEQK